MLPTRDPRSPTHAGLPPLAGRGLVIPPPGPRDPNLSLAFARYLTVTCQRFLGAAERLHQGEGPLREAWRRAAPVIQRVYAKNQKAALGCFAAPGVGTPIHCLDLREALPGFEARIDRAAARALPHLLLEVAARRLFDGGESLDVPLADSDVGSDLELATPTLGLGLGVPARATALRFGNARVDALAGGDVVATLPLDEPPREGDASGFTVRFPYRRVGRVTRLALVDHNPIAEFEAHPDKAGNHVDLGGRSEDDWARTLDEAFAIIERYCPDLFAEMGMLLHEVVPVGWHAERHLSASYREAIGTVYLTLHPNVMTMAEALIHEFQHNKANVAAYSADFIVNAFPPRYPSPVRPDPRPLWGILLAVHAFLPVAVLYRRMRAAAHPRSSSPEFDRRLSEIDLKNHEGMEMLRAHAQWTREGRALMDELEALDRAHMAERAARGLSDQPTEVHLA